MNFQEAIDQILLSPGPLCYQSLNDLFETAINTSPQALFKSLDLYYLGKKFDSLEDLLLISLFYKTYINLNKQLKTSYYSFDYEIYSINKILKERLISLFETKKLKNACFCSVLKQKEPRPKNFSEIIIQAQINIKLLSEYLFQPFFKSEDGLGFGLGFLGRIFLSWGLILEVSFDKEGLLLIIDLMKMSINPRLYRASSFLWGLDYAKLWVLLKVILKSQTIESLDCVNFNPKMNSQVFFEVFQEEGIKKYVRECWELLKGFTLKKEEVFLNGWKSILEVACTKKTLIFFLEISKALKKAKEIKLLWRFNEELVLNGLLGKLKGVFFFEVLEILKLYLFGFVRRYILRKEEWRILIGNLCFIAQEYLQNEKNDSKIKEYYEFLFSLARCYAIFYEKDQQFQRFEKKGQVETILQRMKRNYGLSDPNNYLFQLNYESLLFQEEELEQIQTLSINQTDNLIRDFAQLLNTGFICYLNSFLQSLYATTPFRDSILNLNPTNFPNDNEELLLNLKLLFVKMQNSSLISSPDKINPSFFKAVAPQPFRDSKDQQDTMEFGRSLLAEIEKKTKDSPLKGLIKELFSVEIEHRYECQTCKKVSINTEESLDIPLSFSQDSLILDTFEHDFKEMLRKSLKDEELAGDNQKHCENCKRKSELTIKKSKFKHLAPIIILRANRFSKNNKNKIINRIKIEEKLLISDILSSNSFNEIEEEIIPSERDLLKNSNFKKINFFSNPLEINDLNEEISSKKESNSRESKEKALLNNDKIHLKEDCYSLYCIIFHKGVSNECGHYFSLLKDFRDGAWFLIDDQNQHIEKKDEDFEFPPDETPYIFYYMRKNLN